MEEDFYKFNEGFYSRDGSIYCEDVNLKELMGNLKASLKEQRLQPSPAFVYSKRQIIENIRAYTDPLKASGLPFIVGYAVKAYVNPHVLGLVKEEGCGAVTVSGHEIQAALDANIDPSKIIFNGNGKTRWELEVALFHGCLVNVDSVFDVKHVINVAEAIDKPCDILIRINPNINAQVHPYLATGIAASKFGVDDLQIEEVLRLVKSTDHVNLVGIHCHLGSTIENVNVYSECVDVILSLITKLKSENFNKLKFINIGGGLGIDYHKHEYRTKSNYSLEVKNIDSFIESLKTQFGATQEIQIISENLRRFFTTKDRECLEEVNKSVSSMFTKHPEITRAYNRLIPGEGAKIELATPHDLIQILKAKLDQSGLTVILEPGRSIIANSAVLLTSVIGVKNNYSKKYIVVDGSMTEVIRPALYGAYHHIEINGPLSGREKEVYDIVGPVCECADFLGQERLLTTPKEDDHLVIFDVGAYASSMASNYNMRCHPVEVMIDSSQWTIIRKPDSYRDLTRNFTVYQQK